MLIKGILSKLYLGEYFYDVKKIKVYHISNTDCTSF